MERDNKGKFIKGHKKVGNYSTPKGVPSPMKGKHHTEEAREKNRQKHLGMKPNANQLKGLEKGRGLWKGKKLPYPVWNKGLSPERQPAWKGGITLGENKKRYYANKVIERRSRQNDAPGSHTFGEWETLKAQYNWTCPHCKKSEPTIKLTEDHLIPLIKGGSNNIANIQPLCGKCNSRKGARLISFIC